MMFRCLILAKSPMQPFLYHCCFRVFWETMKDWSGSFARILLVWRARFMQRPHIGGHWKDIQYVGIGLELTTNHISPIILPIKIGKTILLSRKSTFLGLKDIYNEMSKMPTWESWWCSVLHWVWQPNGTSLSPVWDDNTSYREIL